MLSIARFRSAPAPEGTAMRPLSVATVLASTIGLVSSGALASGTAPGVEQGGAGVPAWLAWAGSAAMTLAPLVIDRWLAYRAAKTRARAASLDRAAARAEADTDPSNDAAARRARDLADELRAEADATDAAAKGPRL